MRRIMIRIAGLAILSMMPAVPAHAGAAPTGLPVAGTAAAEAVGTGATANAAPTGYYATFRNADTKLCLRQLPGSERVGTGPCITSAYSRWYVTVVATTPFYTWYRLQNLYSGKCLEARDSVGAYAHVGTCRNSTRQSWSDNHLWLQNAYRLSLNPQRPSCLRGYPSNTVNFDFCSGLRAKQWTEW